jgi:pyruvate/2-oxoglutarate dehydrogenase complex dihydrolipoamide dehydrogenase (E3) component
VVGLKSLADGRRLKSLVTDGLQRVVIVGMGYIALEMAEALRALDLEVSMVKPRPVFLPWMPEEMARIVREEVEAHQVAVHAGHQVERIEADDRGLRVICQDLDLSADLVLVAVGITPNTEFAARAGIELGSGGAITVDRRLQTSVPDIYAAGDCADAYHVVTGEKVWVPLALRANRAGWAVADNVVGTPKELPGVASTAVFKTFDMQVARTGLTVEEASAAGFDPAAVTIKSRSRAHAHPDAGIIHVHMIGDRASGRLLGVQMVGREGVAHRINGPAVALHGQMTVDQFSQCDLAYAPPFGPTWDPMLTAANQLLKRL